MTRAIAGSTTQEVFMVAATSSLKTRPKINAPPRYVYHPSFPETDAERAYGRAALAPQQETTAGHMADEVTRASARGMHYAAYRWETAGNTRERTRWQRRYFALRDGIVLGNRKLIFRAVQKWKSVGYQADDLIGECHIVLIRVVATYNPWLNIRFSTFAFTCLMRALSRLWERLSLEEKRQPLFLEQLTDADVSASRQSSESNRWEPLEEFLREDHALLSEREKIVLKRRYGLCDSTDKTTLEAVGRDLGLSKERIRQLEKAALDKLRRALGGDKPSV
jgi:RNA polymerase sigma factor (sigma-70 family)